MRQDALEKFFEYKQTNSLFINDTQTTVDKIFFYQNELENLVQNRTKGATVSN